jgi:hypothetical protein
MIRFFEWSINIKALLNPSKYKETIQPNINTKVIRTPLLAMSLKIYNLKLILLTL